MADTAGANVSRAGRFVALAPRRTSHYYWYDFEFSIFQLSSSNRTDLLATWQRSGRAECECGSARAETVLFADCAACPPSSGKTTYPQSKIHANNNSSNNISTHTAQIYSS